MSNSPGIQDFEFDPLRSTTVTLPQSAVDWAIRVIQSEENPDRQWRSFLRALALKGFQQWVEAGALDVAVYYDAEQVPPMDVNCRVGDFRLCLIAQGGLSDEGAPIPTATLDDPGRFAHLYVLTEVQEEAERVTILSGLRRDRLLAHQRQSGLEANADGTYTVPVRYFDTLPEELLLYLTCLNPDQLARAAHAGHTVVEPVMTTPLSPELLPQVGSDFIINVGHWLSDQIGEVAERFAWMLLPPLGRMEALMPIRSPVEEIEAVLTEMAACVTIPSNARGAYTDCQPLGVPFRLYAFTWTLLETEAPEWSLLLLLGPSGDHQLPPGTRLIIRDRPLGAALDPQDSVLVEQTIEPNAESTYLYGQVVGAWDESFLAIVELPNGSTVSWPPFVFQPDAK